ncbi:RNA polymerase sigma factor [Mycolicibacterium arenosum]|uniref:Uncharacterized protein n=1 Tax=Mycolicibacterium arenosum TaxID=2952157 RepID=A0ABT1MGB3_9MYCO|nr:hypothetical protein [Mycolicibacterium sp. CAU 1645]MCP9276792.1 hypothetical protein [Mycolicibacterium sp. CAU 1645]
MTAADPPVRDVVDGFDLIADRPIPYGRLPRRARTVFGEEFRLWGDLADQTVGTLTGHPKAGRITVDALLAAAREAAGDAGSASPGPDDGTPANEAVRRLLNRLDDYDRELLSARGWALRPSTIAETAARLGVSRNNVVHNQPRARRRLTELLEQPEHAEIVHAAAYLRWRLGPVTRAHTVGRMFGDLGLRIDSDAGQLLLHVAGPYAEADDWLEIPTGAGGLADARAILDRLTRFGAPTTGVLVDGLAAIGVPARTAEDLIRTHPGLQSYGEHWVGQGPTAVEKITAALRLVGEPVAVEEITAGIGEEIDEQTIRDALRRDDRFIRVTRTRWALRVWGGVEYTGLFDEIATCIDAHRAPVPTDAIVADIAAALPDVKRTSVRGYLSAPGFVIENGAVRRRTAADGWPAVAPLNTVRGVFRNGANEIRVALPVTRDLLRGSGTVVSPALATALGVHPGGRRQFDGPTHDVTLSWRESALNGGRFGSLRALATDLGVALGDTLVLVFDVVTGGVHAVPLAADTSDSARLRVLLGRTGDRPVADLALALDCTPEQVRELLHRRGDGHLLPVPE